MIIVIFLLFCLSKVFFSAFFLWRKSSIGASDRTPNNNQCRFLRKAYHSARVCTMHNSYNIKRWHFNVLLLLLLFIFIYRDGQVKENDSMCGNIRSLSGPHSLFIYVERAKYYEIFQHSFQRPTHVQYK